ncbi:MAG TPA: potassium-transporting ATPase subunit C [Candidatus Binatia bacterium]|jgi:K+-transporting ATPase ATPase C chain
MIDVTYILVILGFFLVTIGYAKARSLDIDTVTRMIDEYTQGPDLGVLGDPGVNVLRLNLALDRAAR